MLHDKLKKMLGKKRDLSENEKNAKMDVLKDLRGHASEAMGHKLGKVSVMSNSQEGLKNGLKKAGQVVSSPEMAGMLAHAENPYGDLKSAMEEHQGELPSEKMFEGGEVEGEEESPDQGDYEAVDEGSPAEEESESPEEEASEEDDEEFHGLNMDEIKNKIQKLMELHKKMESSQS